MSFASATLRRTVLAALSGWLVLVGSASAQRESALPVAVRQPNFAPLGPQQPQPAVNPAAQPAAAVRIVNRSKGNFNYQVSRSSGPSWTNYYALPANMVHIFTADPLDQPSVIRTLNVYSNPGYLFLRFPIPGGFEVFKILTGKSYTYVVNDNGYGELLDSGEVKDQSGYGSFPAARTPAGFQGQAIFELDSNHNISSSQRGVPTAPLNQARSQRGPIPQPAPQQAPAPLPVPVPLP